MAWSSHLRIARAVQRRAFETANRDGDLIHAAFDCYHLNTNLLAAGDPLSEVQREAENGLAFVRKIRFDFAVDVVTTQLALIRTLRGLTPGFGVFDDADFDERQIERRFAENQDWAFGECWYWIRKLQARFFAGDYAIGLHSASKQNRCCGLHCHSSKRLNTICMPGFPTQARATLPPQANRTGTSRR